VPNLKTLYLHNNAIMALSPLISFQVPSLTQIHLYHNPLRCDCNALWIWEAIHDSINHNISNPLFVHSQYLKCVTPVNVTSVPLQDLEKSQIPRVCSPSTLPSFHENYTMDLGEELRLECHSLGVPEPSLSWVLPNGSQLQESSSSQKFEIVDTCVLIVRFLSVNDSGTYECRADNGVGFDISSTKVTVTNKPVRLVFLSISFDYISLTWNGTHHQSMISDYQIHYKEFKTHTNQTDSTYRIIPLGTKYKFYTITELSPSTPYEFCLVYIYDTEYYKVDCEVYKTSSKYLYQSAIKKIVNEKIIAGVCTALGIVMAIACMITLVRKFRIHKDYEIPFGSEAEGEGVHIPMHVYQPLSTPLCSSKTSLLSSKTSRSNFDDY